MNLDLFKKLIFDIPGNLDKNQIKEKIIDEIKIKIKDRSKGICELCNNYDSKKIHHIIPNGSASEENLIDLCNHCHNAIHLFLFTFKKWKFPYIPTHTY